jgi:hypothetical protein
MEAWSRRKEGITNAHTFSLYLPIEIIHFANPIIAAETSPQTSGERVRIVLPVPVRTPRMDRRVAHPLGPVELDVVPHLHVAPEAVQRAAHDKVQKHACAGLGRRCQTNTHAHMGTGHLGLHRPTRTRTRAKTYTFCLSLSLTHTQEEMCIKFITWQTNAGVDCTAATLGRLGMMLFLCIRTPL